MGMGNSFETITVLQYTSRISMTTGMRQAFNMLHFIPNGIC